MADGTRNRVSDDFRTSTIADLAAIKSELTNLATVKADIAEQRHTAVDHQAQLHAIASTMSSLVASVTAIQRQLDQNLRNHPPRDPIPLRSIKLDFPRFNGTESPEDWLFKATEFFAYHSTPEDQRLMISSFHMDGVALSWFQWIRKNQQLSTWPAFSAALVTRFGYTPYSSPQGALTKLLQTSTVASYQAKFEALANQTTDLPPAFFLDCFIEGLRPEIRRRVKYLAPSTFSAAVGIARLQEADLTDSRRPPSDPLLHVPTTRHHSCRLHLLLYLPVTALCVTCPPTTSRLAKQKACVFIVMKSGPVGISAVLANFSPSPPTTSMSLSGILTPSTTSSKTARLICPPLHQRSPFTLLPATMPHKPFASRGLSTPKLSKS